MEKASRRDLLIGAATVAVGGALSRRASANGPAVASYANNRPAVVMFGDSITYGVGSHTTGGYREILWRALEAAGAHCAFVGSQYFSGDLNTFVEYPGCEGYPGITADPSTGIGTKFAGSMAASFTDCVTLAVGTNDIGAGGQTAATTVSNISTDLDKIWALRTSNRLQIGLFTILRRLDGFDSTVQAANALLPAMIAGKSYAANITLIDVYAACSVSGDYSDGVLHPNDTGCPKVAAAALTAFKAMVNRARLP